MVPKFGFPHGKPHVTLLIAHVTAVLVAFVTVAVNWKLWPTVSDVGEVPKAIVTAGGVVVGGVAPPPPQPAITITRLKMIARMHVSRRSPRLIDPAPTKFQVSLWFVYTKDVD
jgi:hypothetical protein